MTMMATEQILGVRFFNGTVEEAVDSLSLNGGLLVVPAAPALVRIRDDEDYRQALTSADVAIADSGAMVMLWKIFTGRRVERISGLKFLKCLLARLSRNSNERVLWVVPSEAARQKAMGWLHTNGISVSHDDFYVSPRYGKPVGDDALAAKINKQSPKYVVIGIGGGTQEKLGLFLREQIRARPAIICIGAALGFVTGDQPPIPMWADRFYLGWLLRLLRQPCVFGPRYLSAFKLPGLIVRYREKLPTMKGR